MQTGRTTSVPPAALSIRRRVPPVGRWRLHQHPERCVHADAVIAKCSRKLILGNTMTKQLLHATFLIMVIGLTAIRTTSAASLPTDGEAIAAYVDFLDSQEDIDKTARANRDMPDMDACMENTILARSRSCFENVDNIYAFERKNLPEGTTLAEFKRLVASFNVKECIAVRDAAGVPSTDFCTRQLHAFEDFQSKIAAYHHDSLNFVYKVARKGDYEGVVIAYVESRRKQTDEWQQTKLTLNIINGKWEVVSVEQPQ